MVDKKPLTIYRASAGSGKTFRLAVEYIKLVVNNPACYRKILAVTFTNKATEEMKMRILSQLYGIHYGLESSRGYLEKVCEELGQSESFVRKQAMIALEYLLHDYSGFRVETIDTFFQSVLRNLARELQLTANLRIGLNDYQVEELAVDQMIEDLTTQDLLLQWIMKYIMDNISDDRSWNIIGQVKSFGRTIFRDYYKAESKALNTVIQQKDFFERYAETLIAFRKNARSRMAEISEAFFEVIDREGLTVEDFSYGKSGVAGIFQKLRDGVFDQDVVTKRVIDAQGDAEKWISKTKKNRLALLNLVEGELLPILNFALQERELQYRKFQSAELTLRHLNQLRLLSSIEQKVRALNEEQNRFLLSDTQQLLHSLIEGSDSPFIFEKIGTQLEHIMIDEFQDTSTVQWQNFKVLLEETMSHEGTENLIVGDVKQSIYRWRSGDWRLLENIQQQFSNAAQRLQFHTLKTNYRSCKRVVDFNNCFFKNAAESLEAAAYHDVEQELPNGRPEEGWVQIRLLPKEDYEEQTMNQLVEWVDELLAAGVPANEIAILVRTNKFIPLIANHFLAVRPSLTLVSDEAFRLDASQAVVTLVQAMRLLTHPDDSIAIGYLKKLQNGSFYDELPEAFTAEREQLLRLPLTDLAERLFAIFHLDKMAQQSAYVCAFYDQLADFVSETSGDIDAFLNEWNTTLCSKTIQSSEAEGIRLISIHKSKGLEFAHVLMPFSDWRLEHGDLLWCKPKEAPFNELPLVPIDYSQKMKGSIYEDDYLEENQQNTIDNLNLLYVGFTRAKRSLLVIGRRKGTGTRSELVEKTLPEVAKTIGYIEGVEDEKCPILFEYGTLSVEQKPDTSGKIEENVFLRPSTPIDVDINIFDNKISFKQSNQSRLFATAPDDDEQMQRNAYIQMGCILHQVFSTVRTVADIEPALRQMELDGVLYNQHVTRERLEDLIRRRLQDPRVAEWFSADRHWTIFNECTILNTDADGHVYERRPDRVMSDGQQWVVIDFKFGQPRDEYHDQVREYMSLLKRMGCKQVSGYLWFVYSNKIIEVQEA